MGRVCALLVGTGAAKESGLYGERRDVESSREIKPLLRMLTGNRADKLIMSGKSLFDLAFFQL